MNEDKVVGQLARKHYESFCKSHDGFVDTLEAAIREAISLTYLNAAKVAEELYDKTYWDDPSAGIAAVLRRLASTPTLGDSKGE